MLSLFDIICSYSSIQYEVLQYLEKEDVIALGCTHPALRHALLPYIYRNAEIALDFTHLQPSLHTLLRHGHYIRRLVFTLTEHVDESLLNFLPIIDQSLTHVKNMTLVIESTHWVSLVKEYLGRLLQRSTYVKLVISLPGWPLYLTQSPLQLLIPEYPRMTTLDLDNIPHLAASELHTFFSGCPTLRQCSWGYSHFPYLLDQLNVLRHHLTKFKLRDSSVILSPSYSTVYGVEVGRHAPWPDFWMLVPLRADVTTRTGSWRAQRLFNTLPAMAPISLTTLHLDEVVFQGHLLCGILDSCPTVKKLVITNCTCDQSDIAYALATSEHLQHFELNHRDHSYRKEIIPPVIASPEIRYLRFALNYFPISWLTPVMDQLLELHTLVLYGKGRYTYKNFRRSNPNVKLYSMDSDQFNLLVNRQHLARS
ncbi:hypothetical protein IWQ61_006588 [Dispira simplex]|nr:hypothetical protein IWQ61_006588 [Dispira simplex]